MNAVFIQECLQNNVDVTLTVKASDLTAFGQFLIDNAERKTAELQRLKDEEVFYTTDEVLELLSIKDRTSLWRWKNKGYLVPERKHPIFSNNLIDPK